jgi:hypothetical protein
LEGTGKRLEIRWQQQNHALGELKEISIRGRQKNTESGIREREENLADTTKDRHSQGEENLKWWRQ